MTDREKFLAKILAEPGEDAHRLVFADWLQEHGEHERAATIRHQIAFAGGRIGWTADVLSDGERGFPSFPGLPLAAVVFRRGFVGEVHLTAAAFLGAPCPCGITRSGVTVYDGLGQRHCPDCHGTGRTPGLAKAIFAAHPVVSVVLTDKQPYWRGGAWCYYRRNRPRPSQSVPESATLDDELYLRGHTTSERRESFTSVAAGQQWLSAAAVAFGREAAGLPPL